MKTVIKHIAWAVICLILPHLLLQGCSVIGLVIGAIKDGSKEDYFAITSLHTIPPGQELKIVMKDQTEFECMLISLKQSFGEDYADLYRAALDSLRLTGRLPLPGDSVDFSSVKNPRTVGRARFIGVDPGALVLSEERVRVPLYELAYLRVVSGRVVDLTEMQVAVASRHLPTLTTIAVVQVGENYVELPVSQITRIKIDEAGNAALTGFAIGLAADACVALVVAKSADSFEKSCANSASNDCKTNK